MFGYSLCTPYGTLRVASEPAKVASLPRLVTPAKVPAMAAQLQGMFETPLGFVSAKI